MTKPITKSYIKLSVIHVGGKYPKGAYVAKIYAPGGAYKKQRQMSLTEHNSEHCYEGVVLWAKDEAKEHKIKFVESSKVELDEQLACGSSRPATTRTQKDVGIFSTKQRFNYHVSAAVKITSYARITEVLEAAIAHIKTLQLEEQAAVVNINKASKMLAKAMYDIWVKTKVNMAGNINDKEALTEYKKLVANHTN